MAQAAAALATNDDAERLSIGGNRGPLTTLEELAEQFAPVVADTASVLNTARELPEEIADDAGDAKVTDVVHAIQKEIKRGEALRVETKAPFLAGERIVDSFFNGSILDKLTKTKAILEGRLTVFKRKKAAAERERLAEEARKRDEEAAEARRVAEVARQKAERERLEAETAAAFEETQAPLAPINMAPVVAAENAAHDAAQQARTATVAANAKGADLTRSRSESGKAGSTLVLNWLFEINDAGQIPLEALRPYITRAELSKAVARYVDVNKGDKPLAGVRIYSEEKARVY